MTTTNATQVASDAVSALSTDAIVAAAEKVASRLAWSNPIAEAAEVLSRPSLESFGDCFRVAHHNESGEVAYYSQAKSPEGEALFLAERRRLFAVEQKRARAVYDAAINFVQGLISETADEDGEYQGDVEAPAGAEKVVAMSAIGWRADAAAIAYARRWIEAAVAFHNEAMAERDAAE